MIHVNSVTSALFTLMSSDSVLVSSGFTVQEGEAFNRDINHTPWVGLYYGEMTIDPHTLGGDRPWQAQIDLFLYVQAGSHLSGQEVTRALARSQSRVLDAVNADKTLGGAVQMLDSITVAPFRRDIHENTWLFTNEIVLKASLRS